jgi:hypothetical protein
MRCWKIISLELFPSHIAKNIMQIIVLRDINGRILLTAVYRVLIPIFGLVSRITCFTLVRSNIIRLISVNEQISHFTGLRLDFSNRIFARISCFPVFSLQTQSLNIP